MASLSILIANTTWYFNPTETRTFTGEKLVTASVASNVAQTMAKVSLEEMNGERLALIWRVALYLLRESIWREPEQFEIAPWSAPQFARQMGA